MPLLEELNPGKSLIKGYIKIRSSIYGRVVFIIAILSVFLFVSFGIIFRSVNDNYIQTVISQNGNNVGSMVEGALYYSMLENDKSSLQNTLDVLNNLSGIEDVNLYDSQNKLVYSTFSGDPQNHSNPDCISCHSDLEVMFPFTEKSYRIIDAESECKMNVSGSGSRNLLIRSPILNARSCYTSSCHAHSEQDVVLGSLIIKMSLADLDAAIQKSSANFYLLAVIITLLLGSSLIIFTGKKIKKPLSRIIEASQSVSNGDMNTRLDISDPQLDDIRMLSQAFNNMLDNIESARIELQNWSQQLEYKVQKKSEELLEAQNELIHIERIASIGKLSSSVAHEINNPLSGVLTYAKLIHKQLSKLEIDPGKKEGMLKNLKIIEAETKRCGDIVKGLLDFSKKDQQNFEDYSLHRILKETYDLMSHQMKIGNIEFISYFSASEDLVFCSSNQIKQACVAMLVNSSEAITENGEIHIKTSNPDPHSIRFEIRDNGTGISPSDLPHIFEPFFSAKQKVSGIGLGLAIVHGIVQNHNGSIEVESEPGKGTSISVSLPLSKERAV